MPEFKIEDGQVFLDKIEALRKDLDEAREEARYLAECAFGENWALWETELRDCEWLATPELYEKWPFLKPHDWLMHR